MARDTDNMLFGTAGHAVNLWDKLNHVRPSLRIRAHELTPPTQTAYDPSTLRPFVLMDAPKGFALECLQENALAHVASHILVLVQPGDVPTSVQCLHLGAHHVVELNTRAMGDVARQIDLWHSKLTTQEPKGIDHMLRRSPPPLPQPLMDTFDGFDETPLPPPLTMDLTSEGIDMSATLDEMERKLLITALDKAMGNKAQAARLLGLNRTTFVEKLKRLKSSEES